MATITLPTQRNSPHLRSLNILKDLPAVADLIEQCFSDTMDSDGRQYIKDMRRAGNDNSFTKWADRVAETTSLPLTGYVWEENNQIIGNVSVVPFRNQKKKLYLIANVAVHPNHRRKGIAHALTERALQHIRDKKVNDAWLHVRADNSTAINIYNQLGFREQARRTTWQAIHQTDLIPASDKFTITKRFAHFWQTQRLWLLRLYPDGLAWHQNWNILSLRPGFWNWLYLFLTDTNVRQWAITKDNHLHATLSFSPYGQAKGLYLATGDRSDKEAVKHLLKFVRHEVTRYHPKLGLDFPVSEFDEVIQEAGFKPTRTLIWMHATL